MFETANLKLSSVVSDSLGVTGRRFIEGMIAGEESAEILSWKVRGRLRKKEKVVKESLKGYFPGHAWHQLGSHQLGSQVNRTIREQKHLRADRVDPSGRIL